MKTKAALAGLFLLTGISVYAEGNSPLEPKNFVPLSQEAIIMRQQNEDRALDDLYTNKAYLNFNKEDIERVKRLDGKVREAFDGFSQKEINYKPVVRPMASMDVISLHPYFTFSMLLPAGSVITHVDSSTELAVLKFDSNVILLRPKGDFKVANITILYKLDDKNQIFNVLANRYEKSPDEKLNLLYSYENKSKLNSLDVINAYVKEYGKYPDKEFNYVNIDGITYRIVQDSKYGDTFIKNKAYRIDNNTIHK